MEIPRQMVMGTAAFLTEGKTSAEAENAIKEEIQMKRRSMVAFLVALLALGVFAGTTAANSCDGVRQASHTPQNHVWWTVGYSDKYVVVNFWTNWAGYSQKSHKVAIPKGQKWQLGGGGEPWTFNCRPNWNYGYSHNPLPAWTLKHLKNVGLARRLS